jgi:hypothetical protein
MGSVRGFRSVADASDCKPRADARVNIEPDD